MVRGRLPQALLRALELSETSMFMAIAVALVVVAVIVFVRGVHDLVLTTTATPFAVTVTRAINSALFIVVVPELVRTIIGYPHGRR
jgi:uncharacterized membrane protein (DUF373 family)